MFHDLVLWFFWAAWAAWIAPIAIILLLVSPVNPGRSKDIGQRRRALSVGGCQPPRTKAGRF